VLHPTCTSENSYLLTKKITRRGDSQGVENEESRLFPLSSSSSLSPEDSDSEEDSSPRTLVAAWAAHLRRSSYFCVYCLLFLPGLASHLTTSLSRVIPLGSLRMHPRPYNISTGGVKKEGAEIGAIKQRQAQVESPWD
jgi:hypothetical protein